MVELGLFIGIAVVAIFAKLLSPLGIAWLFAPKRKRVGPRWYEDLNWEHAVGGAFALIVLIGIIFYAKVMLDPKVAAENEAYQQMKYRSNLRAQRDTAIRAGAEAAVSGDTRTLLEMDKKVRQLEEQLKQ